MSGPVRELRARQRQILRQLWRGAGQSRQELHRKLRAHPNLVGRDVSELIDAGLLCEGTASSSGRGRPSIPLTIDEQRRHVLGLALTPGAVNLARLTLRGEPLEAAKTVPVSQPNQLVAIASQLLKQSVDDRTISIGITTTGLLDEQTHELLLSSTVPDQRKVSLAPVIEAAGRLPVVLRNDMHALAMRWLLGPDGAAGEDVLIVSLSDGRIGSAMLIDGQINRGCLLGANELGHMRFPIPTPVCFCGEQGCLERIFSTEYLNQHGPVAATLRAAIAKPYPSPAARQIMELTADAIANVVNFVRPNRLVITGALGSHRSVFDTLLPKVRRKILCGLVDRVRIEHWSPQATGAGETAAWLGIALWFLPWDQPAWWTVSATHERQAV